MSIIVEPPVVVPSVAGQGVSGLISGPGAPSVAAPVGTYYLDLSATAAGSYLWQRQLVAGAAPSLRAGSAATNHGTTTATVTVPGVVQVGDVMVALIMSNTNAYTFSGAGAGGWTLVQSGTETIDASIYVKTATASDLGAVLTVTNGAAFTNIGFSAYENCGGVNVSGVAVSGAASPVNSPTVITTVANCDVLTCVALSPSFAGGPALTIPGTSDYVLQSSGSYAMGISENDQAVAGGSVAQSVSITTSSGNSANWIFFTVALYPSTTPQWVNIL